MRHLAALLERCVLFPLSFLVPRRPRTWVFGAPQDAFAGNPKWLFLQVGAARPDVRAVWLTGSAALRERLRSEGYRCELRWSPRGVWAAARAGYHFVANDGSDTSFGLTGGTRVFNLWHGVGIKNIRRGASVGPGAARLARRRHPIDFLRSVHEYRRPAFVLATSQVMALHFARCFGVPVRQCPVLGYPRMDPMVDPAVRELGLRFGDYGALDRLLEGYDNVYLYAPTIRSHDRGLLAEALPDLGRLSAALRPSGGVLVLKLHPFTGAQVAGELAGIDNIVLWPGDLDLYPVFDRVDCLITDYSSILYDYLFFARRGVVVYSYDYERYVARDRDLAFPFEESITGARAGSFDELCAVISGGAALAALDEGDLDRLRLQFWGSTSVPARPAGPGVADFAARRLG